MTLNTSKTYQINNITKYEEKSVVSRELIKKESGTVTMFAFDENEGLSEHSAPFDALVQVIDGRVEIKIDNEYYNLSTGEIIIMPANIPHALKALTKFKMILTLIKSE